MSYGMTIFFYYCYCYCFLTCISARKKISDIINVSGSIKAVKGKENVILYISLNGTYINLSEPVT
jgi:hypothetical protein